MVGQTHVKMPDLFDWFWLPGLHTPVQSTGPVRSSQVPKWIFSYLGIHSVIGATWHEQSNTLNSELQLHWFHWCFTDLVQFFSVLFGFFASSSILECKLFESWALRFSYWCLCMICFIDAYHCSWYSFFCASQLCLKSKLLLVHDQSPQWSFPFQLSTSWNIYCLWNIVKRRLLRKPAKCRDRALALRQNTRWLPCRQSPSGWIQL